MVGRDEGLGRRGRRGGDSHFPLAASALWIALLCLSSRLLSLFHDVTHSFFLSLPSALALLLPLPSPQPRLLHNSPAPPRLTSSLHLSLPYNLSFSSGRFPRLASKHLPFWVISLEPVRPNCQSVSSPSTPLTIPRASCSTQSPVLLETV